MRNGKDTQKERAEEKAQKRKDPKKKGEGREKKKRWNVKRATFGRGQSSPVARVPERGTTGEQSGGKGVVGKVDRDGAGNPVPAENGREGCRAKKKSWKKQFGGGKKRTKDKGVVKKERG